MDTSGGEAACKSYVLIFRATRVKRKDKTKFEGQRARHLGHRVKDEVWRGGFLPVPFL
jgi:hypothetical protein